MRAYDLSAKKVIELYCQHWSLEETFGWVKSRLGLEARQNRTEHAVHRADGNVDQLPRHPLVRELDQGAKALPDASRAVVPSEEVAELFRYASNPAAPVLDALD